MNREIKTYRVEASRSRSLSPWFGVLVLLRNGILFGWGLSLLLTKEPALSQSPRKGLGGVVPSTRR